MAVREYRRNGPEPKEFIFPVGSLRVTRLAINALGESGSSYITLLLRHARGDRGMAGAISPENAPWVSVYKLWTGPVIWVVTSADRSETTIAMEPELRTKK